MRDDLVFSIVKLLKAKGLYEDVCREYETRYADGIWLEEGKKLKFSSWLKVKGYNNITLEDTCIGMCDICKNKECTELKYLCKCFIDWCSFHDVIAIVDVQAGGRIE